MGRNRKYDRQDVLDKAMGLFWQNGFLATSMAEITQTTGLNTASMYKEFGDKDGLFEGTLEHYLGQIMAPRFKMLADEPNMHGVEAFLEDVVRGAARNEYRGCLMMNHLAQKHAISPDAVKIIDEFCEAMEGLLEKALSNAKAVGDLPDHKDAAGLASYIMCCVHGLVLYGRHQSRKSDIPKLQTTILKALHA